MPIRITGGMLRGRNISSPDSMKTRPTGSRTREALFNILQTVENYRVLDLFAGSGIIGVEAISRGASQVVAVEMSHSQAHMIYNTYKSLGILDCLTLLEKNALNLSKEIYCEHEKFDLIYADPPFKDMDYPDLRSFLNWLNPMGVAVFEAPSRRLPQWAIDDESKDLAKIRKYGESSLVIYKGV